MVARPRGASTVVLGLVQQRRRSQGRLHVHVCTHKCTH